MLKPTMQCLLRPILSFLIAGGLAASAQTLNNASLTGKYFVRHVEITTNASNAATDARSIVGTLQFSGTGTYTFSGQQVILAGPPASYTSSGTYSVGAAGLVTLTNPQTSSLTINARFASEALIGSSTEASTNVFDLFAAIPAPASTVTATNAALSTSWQMADLEITGGSTSQVRDSAVAVQFDGNGNVTTAAATGHGASIAAGANQAQKFTGVYTVNSDGSGTISFTPPTSLAAASQLLGSGARTIGISASGHMMIAGTPGGHDILIGVRTAATDNITPASFAGRYWVSGLEIDSTGTSSDYAGSVTVISSENTATVSERQHTSASQGHYNETASITAGAGSVNGALSLIAGSTILLPGAGNTVLSVDLGVNGSGTPSGQSTYAIAVGEQVPTLTGSGVFINPQGVVNAASFAPVGNPIAPGEFISLFGSGLSAQTISATPPYAASLGGVSVSIGGLPAPVYSVGPSQITCLVPYAVNTSSGSTTITVTSAGTVSNTVTVPVSATAPGIFSQNVTGTLDGAITHLNGTLVTPLNPANNTETLVIYMTGLGALTNPVTDGNTPNPAAADAALANVQVYVDGVPSPNVLYAGISPSYPGLYQINFYVPITPDHGTQVPVTIVTPDSVHQQVTFYVM